VDKNRITDFCDRLVRAQPGEQRGARVLKTSCTLVALIARIFRGAAATRTEILSWSGYQRDNTELRSGMKSWTLS